MLWGGLGKLWEPLGEEKGELGKALGSSWRREGGQDGATMGQDGAALSVVSEPGCSPERGVKAWVQPTRRRDSWDPGVLSRGVPSEVQLQVWLEVHHPRLGSLAQCAVLAMHVRLGGEAEHAVSRELGF